MTRPRAGRGEGAPEGVLVVDKPSGPTSHDVVARVRRALGTPRVGHAGTLDPMASGVLVVLVGEATKLAPYLTAHEKRYEARVALGRATDTLDADGRVTGEAELPAALSAELERLAAGGAGPIVESALEGERARTEQVPPAFSAIKVDGERSYARARSGESVELAPRLVAVRLLRVAGACAPSPPALAHLDLELVVSKGYYVRSLARDLGERLGVLAHLARLRRTASGPFAAERAVQLERPPAELAASLVPLAAAAAAGLPCARLRPGGVERARHGKRLAPADFEAPPPAESDVPAAWLDEAGRLVAVGVRRGDEYIVERGFTVPLGRLD